RDGHDDGPGLARPHVGPSPRPASMAKRLFLSATLFCVVILLVSGIALSTIYRRTAEANFDERLGVYLRALIADIATPRESSASAPGQLAEPHFEIPLSGWYCKSHAWTRKSPRSETRARSLRPSCRAFPTLVLPPEWAAHARVMQLGLTTGRCALSSGSS